MTLIGWIPTPLEEQDLEVDGNCLGVALRDAFKALEVSPPLLDYTELTTPADAVGVFRKTAGVEMELAAGSGWLKPLYWPQAKFFGLNFARAAEPADGEIVLCMRTMRQLYALSRFDAHWVMLVQKDGDLTLVDRLAESVDNTFADIVISPAESVLGAKGFTLKVRKK